jgi:RNA-binding protein
VSEDFIPLKGKQRRYLRGLGHHLEPVVMVGQHGITDTLVQALEDALFTHELVKVKLGQNCPLHKKEAAEQLAAASGSEFVQLIGKTVLLYRPNPKRDAGQQIKLPQ